MLTVHAYCASYHAVCLLHAPYWRMGMLLLCGKSTVLLAGLVQDPWRRQPFEETELEEIDSFVVAGDCGEAVDAAALPAKLLSSLQPGAEGQ